MRTISDYMEKQYIKAEALVVTDNGSVRIRTLPEFWTGNAGTKYSYAISIEDADEDSLTEMKREQFDEFIKELCDFRDFLDTEIVD